MTAAVVSVSAEMSAPSNGDAEMQVGAQELSPHPEESTATEQESELTKIAMKMCEDEVAQQVQADIVEERHQDIQA